MLSYYYNNSIVYVYNEKTCIIIIIIYLLLLFVFKKITVSVFLSRFNLCVFIYSYRFLFFFSRVYTTLRFTHYDYYY